MLLQWLMWVLGIIERICEWQHFVLLTSRVDLILSIILAWLDGFFARHPKLILRTAQPLSYSRAVNASRETTQDYFAKLAVMYARFNILSKPM